LLNDSLSYIFLFFLQISFYLMSFILHKNNYEILKDIKVGKVINSISYFIITNLIQTRGIYSGFFRSQTGKWKVVNR
ncbi:hypothetical protein, partial [Gottfriedia acidiceleris]|uniref:hypothetical protein n=1 Tax=Gottfriedia acidiceleris TaxID=371036 RepID=UPI002FFED207